MNTTALNKKIQSLPDELIKQVDDFVEFLITKYQSVEKKEELTETEKEELKNLWKEYKENPDNIISIEEALQETKAKYGI